MSDPQRALGRLAIVTTPSSRGRRGEVRILIVTYDGGGNALPALALSTRLARRGHDVTVLGQDGQEASIASGVTFRPAGIPLWGTPHGRPRSGETGTENALVEMTFGAAVMNAVDIELQRGRHDVVIVDCMMLGALTAAVSHDVPVVALFHLLYGPTQTDGHWSANYKAALPLLNALRAQRKLPPLTHVERVWDDATAVLVATPPELDLDAQATRANVHYVGPILDDAPSVWSPNLHWPANDPAPLVLVSFSTNDFDQLAPLQRAVDAVGELRVHAVVTTGPAVDIAAINAPSNVELQSWLPHRDVLPAASAVVTHAGHSTVTAALAYGTPLVCIPTGADQHVNAQRVEAIGAGRALSADADVISLRDAIRSVLESNRYRERARAVQRTIERFGRGAYAVRKIEALGAPEAISVADDELDLQDVVDIDERPELHWRV